MTTNDVSGNMERVTCADIFCLKMPEMGNYCFLLFLLVQNINEDTEIFHMKVAFFL